MSDIERRLRDIVEGIRAEAESEQHRRKFDAAEASARRTHLERTTRTEVERVLHEASPVLAGMGLKPKQTPEEIRVEPIPGSRLPEKFPPWLRISFREPAYPEVRVVVLEVTWRVDDPRTPLPEAPNTVRFVVDGDGTAELADIADFLSIALEDFVASVTRHDTLPGT